MRPKPSFELAQAAGRGAQAGHAEEDDQQRERPRSRPEGGSLAERATRSPLFALGAPRQARPEEHTPEQRDRGGNERDRDDDADQRRQREAGSERTHEVKTPDEESRRSACDGEPRDQDRRRELGGDGPRRGQRLLSLL